MGPFSQSPKYILRSPLFCQHANLDCFHLLTILVSPERAGRHSQDAFPGPRGEHRHCQERAGISSPIEEQNRRSAAVHSQDLDFSRRRILSNQTFFSWNEKENPRVELQRKHGRSFFWVTTENAVGVTAVVTSNRYVSIVASEMAWCQNEAF